MFEHMLWCLGEGVMSINAGAELACACATNIGC